MKAYFYLLLVCAAILCHGQAEKMRFDNHKVFSITPHTDDQVEALQALEMDPFGDYQFWTSPGYKEVVDIVVPPHKQLEFTDFLEHFRLESAIKIENLQM